MKKRFLGKALRLTTMATVLLALAIGCDNFNKSIPEYLNKYTSDIFATSHTFSEIWTSTKDGTKIIQPGTTQIDVDIFNSMRVMLTPEFEPAEDGTWNDDAKFEQYQHYTMLKIICTMLNIEEGDTGALTLEFPTADGLRTFEPYILPVVLCDAKPVPPSSMAIVGTSVCWNMEQSGIEDDIERIEVHWAKTGGKTLYTDVITRAGGTWSKAIEAETTDGDTTYSYSLAGDSGKLGADGSSYETMVVLYDDHGQYGHIATDGFLDISPRPTINLVEYRPETGVAITITAQNNVRAAEKILYRYKTSSDWTAWTEYKEQITLPKDSEIQAYSTTSGLFDSMITTRTAAAAPEVTFSFVQTSMTTGKVTLTFDDTTGAALQYSLNNGGYQTGTNVDAVDVNNGDTIQTKVELTGAAPCVQQYYVANLNNVWYVSDEGNDAYDGKTRDKPKKTIQAVVDVVRDFPDQDGKIWDYKIYVAGTLEAGQKIDTVNNTTSTYYPTHNITVQGTDGSATISGADIATALTVTGGGRDKLNVTLKDITLTKGYNDTKGGGVNIVGGSLTLESGAVITENGVTENGGGVYLASATLTLDGGEITNNAAQDGGGVYAGNYCIVTINNGKISGNTVEKNGGGIYYYNIDNGGMKLDINGGEIRENESTTGDISAGAGIYLYKYQELCNPVYISGSVKITGNKANGIENNIVLPTDFALTVDGSLAGSKIGVTTAATPTASSPVQITSGPRIDDKPGYSTYNSAAPATIFQSDADGYGVVLGDDGEAALAVGGGTINTGSDVTITVDKSTVQSDNNTVIFSIQDKDGNQITSSDISWSVTVRSSGEQQVTSSKGNGNSYTYTVPELPPGTYQFDVTATYDGTTYSRTFDITISE